VELSPELLYLVPEALQAARALSLEVASLERVPA